MGREQVAAETEARWGIAATKLLGPRAGPVVGLAGFQNCLHDFEGNEGWWADWRLLTSA
jgi:hypothetical protein